MTSKELQQYLLREFPQENARCEWKEMKNLKNSFAGDEKDGREYSRGNERSWDNHPER